MRLRVAPAAITHGLVIVRTRGGTRDRAFRITAEEYAALALPGAGAPTGVTADEWTSGRACVVGRIMDADGDMEVQSDRVLLQYADEVHLVFTPGEWSGTPPNITVTRAVLDTLPAGVRPVSIVAGELVKP